METSKVETGQSHSVNALPQKHQQSVEKSRAASLLESIFTVNSNAKAVQNASFCCQTGCDR